MNTNGFDGVTETNAGFINKMLYSAHLMGVFPDSKSGSYALRISNVPESWVETTSLIYHMRIQPPIVKSADADILTLLIPTETALTVLKDTRLLARVDHTVASPTRYDAATRQVSVDLAQASVTSQIKGSTLPRPVAAKLEEILAAVMTEYLSDDVAKPVVITPVLYEGTLPGGQDGLQARVGDTEPSSRTVAAGVNLLGHTGGDLSGIANFTGGTDHAAVVDGDAMHRVFNRWWNSPACTKNHTDVARSIIWDHRVIDWWWDLIVSAIALLLLLPIDWLIGAILSRWVDFDLITSETTTTVSHSNVNFDLKPKNKVQVTGTAAFRSSTKVFVQFTTHWWGRSRTHTVEIFSGGMPMDTVYNYTGDGHVYLASDKRLSVQVDSIRSSFDLPDWDWLGDLEDSLSGYVSQEILNSIMRTIPRIVVAPPLLLDSFPGTNLTIQPRSSKVSSDEDGAMLRSRLAIQGLDHYGKAPFTANKNPSCLEVHKSDCVWAKKILKRNRVPFFFLDEAQASGYDNCFYCLGGSRR